MYSAQGPAGTIPVIETDRLVMRGHRLEDFAAYAAARADPAVIRYAGGKPLSEEEAWARFLRVIGHWSLLGFGFWAVEAKASGRPIGEVGFVNFKRDTEPRLGDAPEIGWLLAAEAHGQGYATEAVRAALDWGAVRFGPVRSVCLIHPDNAPSLRGAENCGYAESGSATYEGKPAVLLSRTLPAPHGPA